MMFYNKKLNANKGSKTAISLNENNINEVNAKKALIRNWYNKTARFIFMT